MSNGDFDGAVCAFKWALQLTPGFFKAQSALAQAYQHLHDETRVRAPADASAVAAEYAVSDLPCNFRREGGQSLVIGGPSLVMLEGEGGKSLVIGGSSLVILEGREGNPL